MLRARLLDDASISVGAEVLKDTSSFEIDESIRVHRTKKKVVARVKEEEEEGPASRTTCLWTSRST